MKRKSSTSRKRKSSSSRKVSELPQMQTESGEQVTEKILPPTYPKPIYQNEREVAMDFAIRVHKKFDAMVKATIFFGSQAQNKGVTDSDVDIIILIDDASIKWDLELVAWYREELGKLIAETNYSKDLHVNTVKLTTWWLDLMHGDPVIINVIRYGEALIDLAGFFKPLKALLMDGKIHSTPEAVYTMLQRSPMHLARSKAAEAGAIEGVYWTMVDSAQAALITLGKLPPSPEHVALMLKENFVETGMLKPDYVAWYREIYDLHKKIAHGEIRDIKGAMLDEWQDRAEKFMKKMIDIVDGLLEARNGVNK